MQYESGTLKNEKITFSVIIGILLFSLVYISTSTFWLKNENQKFKTKVILAHQEISHLLTFDLPSKDSTINYQREEILHQADLIQQVIAENKVSEEEKLKLFNKLAKYINQAKKLRNQIQIVEKEQMEQANYMLAGRAANKKDSLLKTYLKEIVSLRYQKNLLISARKIPEEIEEKPIIKEKISVFYFSARASDRKNRANKTDYIFLNLQLKGDLSTLKCSTLQVEIRDPNNNIITDHRDRILVTNLYKTEYIFKPLIRKSLIKGKYSIRIFCENSDFQHIDFLTFV